MTECRHRACVTLTALAPDVLTCVFLVANLEIRHVNLLKCNKETVSDRKSKCPEYVCISGVQFLANRDISGAMSAEQD